MSIETQLIKRSEGACELSGLNENLIVYAVPPNGGSNIDNSIYISEKCARQLDKTEALNPTFWTCLKDTMWSEIPAVQVVAWRMLNRLKTESWAMEALDMLYLNDDTLQWAKETGDHNEVNEDDIHKDSNGTELKTGDSVVLIKSLDVKGSSVNAKIGTPVRNIKLVTDNPQQIEGKIDGQQIVILTKYVRKTA